MRHLLKIFLLSFGSQFQADPSDLLGINVNGGDDNSSRDSSTAGDRTGNGDPGNPDGKSKRSSRYGSEAEDYDLRAAKRLRYHLDSDELELRRRVRMKLLLIVTCLRLFENGDVLLLLRRFKAT